ncbi:hypothetical protein CR513_32243, partial [Mucuna pruriens]
MTLSRLNISHQKAYTRLSRLLSNFSILYYLCIGTVEEFDNKRSTKSSSNGLNNLTMGPATDDSPLGRCLAFRV